jgi:hypothetical protein
LSSLIVQTPIKKKRTEEYPAVEQQNVEGRTWLAAASTFDILFCLMFCGSLLAVVGKTRHAAKRGHSSFRPCSRWALRATSIGQCR